jgi:lysozyme family protein
MADRFKECLAELFGHEGGLSDRPLSADPGGRTNLGVTHTTYDAWRRSKGLPVQDVAKITAAEAAEIYRDWYWDAVRADDLPIGLDICAFDFCVNSGAGRATRELQKVLGVGVDGHMGIQTIDAARRCDLAKTIRAYVNARRRFCRALSNYRDNPGWEPRWNRVEASALAAVNRQPPPPAPVVTLPPNQQAAITGKASGDPSKPPVAAEALQAAGAIPAEVQGTANAIGKVAKVKDPSALDWLLAFLSEPLVLLGIVMVVSAVFTYRWRRSVPA